MNSRQVVEVADVDAPAIGPREVLVKVRTSLISTGTETAGYGAGGVIARSVRDPSRLNALIGSLRDEGLAATVGRIQAKVAERTPRGYSGAGTVVEVGSEVRGVAVGDRVAYAGAPHAELVAVGEQLLAHIPEGVSFDEAAFGAVACIALHGVRLAEPTLGEQFLVVGLGLVGILAAQFARGSGIKVIGVEPNAARARLARELGVATVIDPSETDHLAKTVAFLTAGHGADAVLLCAAGTPSDVTNRALATCRDRGRVVMIGDMGLDLERGPLFRREITFRVSRSYGPGRYDPGYEAKALDYPIGYVRWTEGRNLACFLDLVAAGVVQVAPMIGDRFPLERAAEAYRALVHQSSERVATLLTYGGPPEPAQRSTTLRRADKPRRGRIQVGVIGCGSFVQQNLLPLFGELKAELRGVANRTAKGFAALEARYRPHILTTSIDELLADDRVDAIVVATRHDTHASLAEQVIRSGKPVHVEKPMAMNLPEATRLVELVRASHGLLTVGFNRRFAPTVEALLRALANMPRPRQFLYRVNAPPPPEGHWTSDAVEGGGRLVGEGCHFIDLICYLAGAEVSAVLGALIGGGNTLVPPPDNFVVTLRFENGDVGTISYSTQGAPDVGKERIEVFAGGRLAVIEDFTSLRVHGSSLRPLVLKRADKGFRGQLENFFDAVRGRTTLRTTAEDGLRVAAIIDAVLSGRPGERI